MSALPSTAREAELRAELIATARGMNAVGLNRGTSGNVSVRCAEPSESSEEGFLITPSALPYDETQAEDIVFMRFDGSHAGRRRPSSEWRFHRDILAARNDAAVVLHAHAPFATSLACIGADIPAFHYMIALAGGDTIRCAPYATFGTQALSDFAVAALAERSACLLANHGLIVLGATLKSALALAVEVEALCEQYWRAKQVGTPRLLDCEEMQRVLAKFKDYKSGTD
jgi:L-fuculose-phosphate aldolase